jgi:translation elongation factor EF-1beta
VCVYKKLDNNVDSNKYPHVVRWYNHINAFTPCQRTRFPGEVKEDKKCSKEGTCTKEEKAVCSKEDKSCTSKDKSCTKDDKSGTKEEKSCATKDKSCTKEKAVCTKEKEKEKEKVEEKEEEEEAVMGWSDNEKEDSDNEEEREAQRIIDAKGAEKRAKDAAAGKKAVIARSTLILDVKPEGSDTDMVNLEANVRAIEMEGLNWKGSEMIPVAYGIKKLRIISVIVDDLVSTDDLCERIQAIEDVQSTDIFAFNKV